MKSLYEILVLKHEKDENSYKEDILKELKEFCDLLEKEYEILITDVPRFYSRISNYILEISTEVFDSKLDIEEFKNNLKTKYLHVYDIDVLSINTGTEVFNRWKVRCVGDNK